MADAASDQSSDGGSSSDLYDTASADHAASLARPSSGKRKAEVDAADDQHKKARRESPPHGDAPVSSTPRNGHTPNPRPASRPRPPPNPSHPLPGTWNSSRPGSVASAVGFAGPSTSANPTHQRNQQVGNERKAARKADIEARCQALDPPLLPNVLSRMSAFHAAIQIGVPLNDQAWETLKAKLLADRAAAEEMLHEEERVIAEARADLEQTDSDAVAAANAAATAAAAAASRPDLRLSLKDSKDAEHREWAAVQAPMRDRLGWIADEYIHDQWSDGTSVTYENSPKFAADCLIHVRRKYFTPLPHDTEAIPGPLVLDAMKWVYDTKIKAVAETHRKDLFLCSKCDSGMKAFEGCIQHFAAKHTNSFSVGTQVVAWHSATWPEAPPFAPDPLRPRPSVQPPPPGTTGYPQAQGTYYAAPPPHDPPPGYPPPQYFPGAHYALPHHPMLPHHQTSPAPYASSNYGDQYQPYGHGASYGAPPAYQGHIPPASPPNSHYPYPQPSPHTPGPSSHGWHAPPYAAAYSPTFHGYGYVPPPPPPPPPNAGPAGYGPPPVTAQFVSAPPGQNLYQAQRDQLTRIANKIWSSISNVKDIPPSVRVYTVLSRAVSHFRSRFKNEPSLDLVSDCVISNPLMTPLKNIKGLACKTCVLNNEDLEEPHPSAFQFRSGGRKLYSFHSLLQHFRFVHADHARRSPLDGDSGTPLRLDWKEDMIELPDDDLIAGLADAKNMDTSTLNVLAAAFPTIFSGSAPRRPSSSLSNSHDNEYDPRNPLMFTPGLPVRSRESSQGQIRVGIDDFMMCSPTYPSYTDHSRQQPHGDDFSLHNGKPSRNHNLGHSVVKLEDGEEYQLVPVGSISDRYRDGTATRHVRIASAEHGYSSSPPVDPAAHFLEELETDPRYRGAPRRPTSPYESPRHERVVSASGRFREAIMASGQEEYNDPRNFASRHRTASSSRRHFYNDVPDELADYPNRPAASHGFYQANAREHRSVDYEEPFANDSYGYADGRALGAATRRHHGHS